MMMLPNYRTIVRGKVFRVAWALLLTLSLAASTPSAAPAAEKVASESLRANEKIRISPDVVLRRAVNWLAAQQSDDGGWHSQTYALMRSGQALTPFVLHALLAAHAAREEQTAAALGFLRSAANADGALGLGDPDVLEYPVYSTAYALRCLTHIDDPRDRPLRRRMATWLAAQQFTAAAGFSNDAPEFGAWGFGGPRSAARPGHVDLAHTRRALQALHDAGALADDARRDAQVFLQLLQRSPQDNSPRSLPDGGRESTAGVRVAPFDGGFFLSPIVLTANKGTTSSDDGSLIRSYATATLDGVLALLAAGVPRDDPRVTAAVDWLTQHPRWDYPQGIPAAGNPWADAVHYYHLAVRAEAYAALDWPGPWREELHGVLLPEQRADGSFCNRRSGLMKEDDPLLATGLAVIALSHAAR